ncbi:hypothetical protein Tco_0938992 [Tanacetum coccineum]|uniref:Uncharacterized protein n=1 Tax=Tanacetum coccineum TaxID=301880 RepID=A0ABQ5DJM4_9ASTR
MVVHNQEEMGEGSAMPTDPHHTPTIIQPSTSQPKKTQKPRRPKRKDTQVPQSSIPSDNVIDEAVNKEMDGSLVVSQHQANWDTIAQTRSENVSKHFNDPLLARGNTLRSGEDRLKLEELIALCTTLQSRVLVWRPRQKTTQATEIFKFEKRVKELKRRNNTRTHRLKSDYNKRVGSQKVESS